MENVIVSAYKKPKLVPSPVFLAFAASSLGVTGIVASAMPAQAYVKVNVTVIAKPVSMSGSATTTSQASTRNSDFNPNSSYFFDFKINDYNSSPAAINNNTESKWGPSIPLYDHLTISTCKIPSCGTGSVPGIVNGSWASSASVNNNQTFVVLPASGQPAWPTAAKPQFQMTLGGNNASGLTTNITGAGAGSATPIRDIIFGTNDIGTSELRWESMESFTWSPATSSTSFTATNIISNLALSANMPVAGANAAMFGSPNLALTYSVNGESVQTYFNVNSLYFERVPGPLPVLGGLAAFTYSRKIRFRLSKLVKS